MTVSRHRNLVAAGMVFGLLCTASVALAANTKAPSGPMHTLVDEYIQIQEALAADRYDGVPQIAKRLAQAAQKLHQGSSRQQGKPTEREQLKAVQQAATALAGSKNLKEARKAFGELSKPMTQWATHAKPKDVSILYCSMAKGGWLQKAGTTANPYYGSSMLTCGQIVGGAGHKSAASAP